MAIIVKVEKHERVITTEFERSGQNQGKRGTGDTEYADQSSPVVPERAV
jgi:hypothetical protein